MKKDDKELTASQAASLLGVSRSYLLQLLEQGQIPYRKRGQHRRVQFEALMQYKEQNEALRRKALEELVALDQELGFE